MIKQIITFLLLFLLLLPTFLLLFTARAHAFLGEEVRENILSLIQGILMMFLLHFFSRETAEEIPVESERELPEGVHFIDTSLTFREEAFFAATNQARQIEGLPPLQLHPQLVRLARYKAQDLAGENYFHHISPNLGSPFTMLKQEGISYLYAGENIGSGLTVQWVHRGLMNSYFHRENILEERFTHLGVGVMDGPQGIMYVQLFIAVDEEGAIPLGVAFFYTLSGHRL